ncbi:MAG TPA: hypothetical protein PKB04_06490 [Phenylobacterium sp.]|nr:hypothetical protein [Phenylobacterium sp.]
MIARLILAGLLAFTAAPALAETLAIVGARVVTLGPAGDLPAAPATPADRPPLPPAPASSTATDWF